MLRVLILDRSNPVFAEWVRGLADAVADLDVRIIFASDKEPSQAVRNLEIVNVHDVPQKETITALERKLSFSCHRVLVPERSFFDYSSFRRCQRYSDLSLEQIDRKITPYLNAFDYLIREKADMVFEGLVDNFMTSAATRIAAFYRKPFFMAYAHYWWSDGLFFVDRLDQTSSEVDRRYQHYRFQPHTIDRRRMDGVFAGKRTTWQFSGGRLEWLKLRLRQVLARRRSYEPISLPYWVCRRASALLSRICIRTLVKAHAVPVDEDYLLFPLHVSPEATLLGSEPELADQFSLIKNISMNLPFGVRLYVKEHPAQQLGYGLDYGFYRRLTALPNVRYFRARAPLRDLILHARCRGVVVINGTVGLEAALLRKPVFVFGRALYGVADCFLKPRDFHQLFVWVQEIRQGRYQFDEDALYAVLQALDDTIVRANIDMTRFKSWAELVLSSHPIYRQLMLRCLQKARAEAG